MPDSKSLIRRGDGTCSHGLWLHDCALCQKRPGECDYGSCSEPAAERVDTRLMCARHAQRGSWEISVCGGCNLPVEACRCEPEDWVSPAGEQLEPPSRIVRVKEVKDAA